MRRVDWYIDIDVPEEPAVSFIKFKKSIFWTLMIEEEAPPKRR
jgi:hypothetical protein